LEATPFNNIRVWLWVLNWVDSWSRHWNFLQQDLFSNDKWQIRAGLLFGITIGWLLLVFTSSAKFADGLLFDFNEYDLPHCTIIVLVEF
jgi:hypothetical protein